MKRTATKTTTQSNLDNWIIGSKAKIKRSKQTTLGKWFTGANHETNGKFETPIVISVDDPIFKTNPSECIYIGRCNPARGLPQSKWANPFKVKDYGLDVAIEKYKQFLMDSPELLGEISNLRGKYLVCWCKPGKCHGDILVNLYNEMYPQ